MKQKRLFGRMAGLTSAALAAMAAAAPVMAAVSENSPGGGNSGSGERVEETAEEENAPAAQDGEIDAETAGVYEFPDTKTSGTVTVVKKWDDQSTNAERPRVDVSISTQKPGKNPLGYTVTFHADAEKGLTFADGSTENDVVYNSSGQIVSGAYKKLIGENSVVWWYTDRTYKKRFKLNENMNPAIPLTDDADVWPKEVTFEVKGYSNYSNEFNQAIPNSTTTVVFTDEVMPADAALIDVDADGDGGVVAWAEENGTIMKVSTQIKGIKVQAAKDSSYMFDDKSKIQTIDFTNLDTTNMTNMHCMFSGCSGLTSLDLSSFDTSEVTDMGSMFENCNSLTNLDVSKFDTGKVTNMNWMFSGCSGLTSVDVSSFDTSKVTGMIVMFRGCCGLAKLNLAKFDTSQVTNMNCMFQNCSGLTSLDLSSFDTSKVTDMNDMFYGCSRLTSLDVSSFDTENVTNMYQMFSDCSRLTSLDLSSFDTSKVTSMDSMFYHGDNLTNLNLSSFDTSEVTDMGSMFGYCSRLTALDLSSFDTSQVTDMGSMFIGCDALTNLTTGVNFKFIDTSYTLPGTWQNTAGETFTNTFTSGTFPSNVADTYTRIS